MPWPVVHALYRIAVLALTTLGPATSADRIHQDIQPLIEAGKFDDAAQRYAEAYAADPNPEYLYARAQALRLAEEFAAAIEVYEAFIQTDPPAQDRADALAYIERCRAPADTPTTTTDAPTAAPTVNLPDPPADAPNAVDAPAPKPDAVRTKTWYRDPIGGALLGTGAIVASAVGGTLYGLSFSAARAPSGLESERAYDRRQQRRRALSIGGATGIAVGGALIVGAIIRYAVVRRRNVTPRASKAVGTAR